VIKRGFWLGAGLAAGATGAVLASRWVKKQTKKMAPTSVARQMQHNLVDLSKRVAESAAEGKRAMEDREQEIRAELDRKRR